MFLNNVSINSTATATSHYKSFFENELSYDSVAKDTLLRTELFGEAAPFRKKWIGGSKEVSFDIRPPVDLFNSGSKFLVPNVSLQLSIHRNDPTYGIIKKVNSEGVVDPNTYKIQITDLKLVMRKVLPSQEHLERYRAKLAVEDAILDFKDCPIRTFQIPHKISTINIPNISTGHLPKQIVFAFTKSESFAGTVSEDIYKMEHFNLSSFNLKVCLCDISHQIIHNQNYFRFLGVRRKYYGSPLQTQF